MKNLYFQLTAAALLTAALAVPAEAGAQKATKVAVVEVYGDPMMGGTDMTMQTVSFYDSQNRLVRKAAYDQDGALSQYYTKQYNAAGQLTLDFSRTWGLQNNGLYGFFAPTDSVTYEYNADGQLAAENQTYYIYQYAYDTDGNLVKKTQLYKNTYTGETTEQNVTTYSDFVAKDCPTKMEYTDLMYGDSYVATLSYTEDGKLLAELDSCYDDGTTLVFKQSKHYTYNADGTLASYVGHQRSAVYDYDTWEITGYVIVATDSVVYTAESTTRTKEETYYYDSYNKEWSKNATYSVTETREFDGQTAPQISVAVVEGKINTNRITLTSVPDASGISVYDLYRDGVKIHRFDSSTAGSTYDDEGLFNGEHEYFVQTVVTAATSSTETGKNVSDVVTVKNAYQLPAPTNVHGVSYDDNYVTEYGNTTTALNIAWDAPAYTDEMQFKGYNVMQASTWGDSFYNATNPQQQETTFTFDLYNYYTEMSDIFIQAVYEYGVANSDTVTIAVADLPLATSVVSVKGNLAEVSYREGTISLSDAANVRVFDTAGRLVAEDRATTSLSLATAPKGVYIVAVERDGKLEMLKVRR